MDGHMKISQEIKLQRGLELAVEITDILNDIIQEHGFIDINDQRIWRGWLHQRSNEDWLALWEVFAEREQDLTPGQSQQILAAMQYFRGHQHQARCMDRGRHKKHAWQAIMVTRELINSLEGRWIPNRVPA